MSDPVKNAEVEDVLSSIRRLVSEDKRPLQVAPNPSPESAPLADRLVLTPALRVQDDVDVGHSEAEDIIAEEAVIDALAEAETVEEAPVYTPEVRQEEISALQDDQGAHDLAENYDDDPYDFADTQDATNEEADGETEVAEAITTLLLTNPTTPVVDVQNADEDNNTEEEVSKAEAESAAESDLVEAVLVAEQELATDTLSEKIAALETAIGGISDQWEPDGASEDDYAGSEPEAMVWEDDISAEEQNVTTQEPLEDTDEGPDSDQALETDVAVDAEAVEEVTKTAETTEVAQDDVVTSAVEESDQGSSEPEGQTEDQVTGFAMGADDQLLDEETLREMINEIVHSELQGALGERITRNVRRLVRREIHRALTARDLG